MDRRFALAIARDWLLSSEGNEKRLHQQHLLPIASELPGCNGDCRVFLKLRFQSGRLFMGEAPLVRIKDESFIKSEELCHFALEEPAVDPYMLLFFEGTPSLVRCVVARATGDLFDAMATLDPPLRPAAYDLPPVKETLVEAEDIVDAMHELIAGGDPQLFGAEAEKFLSAPHILVPLFAHVLSLSSKETIDFPLLLRTIAEQLRALLIDDSNGEPKIAKVTRDHAGFWPEVIGERIAFADGGAARIAGLPSAEPLAMRVGIYSVIPGETDLRAREDWSLTPYVMGDLLAHPSGGIVQRPDPKRLQEAARYVLESLAALHYIESHTDVSYLLVHGPLVNQFTQYDEGEPNFIPCLDPTFLAKYGITQESAEAALSDIPRTPSGQSLWNQFMAVYGLLMKGIFGSHVPIAGVVERTAGNWLSNAVLDQLVSSKRITEAAAKKIRDLLERYEISDDFLFGCVLEEGEYVQPMVIPKNPQRRARDKWREIVGQYPSPYATVLKTAVTNFPYRVEMNPAAHKDSARVLRLLYHTSRLLPRYAFPVGLDIVDKYAKVPDWLSRGVSARIAADVLQRALRLGDPKIVAQVRQFLARTPRDFFYRPQA